MNLLDVKNLSVAFSIHGKKLQAVRNVSFSVKAGEIVGIVGESGCGKSSTAQALLRLDPAQQIEGEVYFDGVDLLKADLSHYRGREIGMVFQDPMTALNPTMRIGKQIAEGLIFHKLATPKEALLKAAELLHLVGIPDPATRIHQYPHNLSGGMRQRVLIAIAMACRPRLLIADEPTTSLDITVSTQILSLLKSFSTTLLLITHDLSIVASVCHRVLVMYAGRIVESAPVEELFHHPKHPYTRMLLQSIPRLDRPKQSRLHPIEGTPPNLFTQIAGCPFAPRCPLATDPCRSHEPVFANGVACWNTSLDEKTQSSRNALREKTQSYAEENV